MIERHPMDNESKREVLEDTHKEESMAKVKDPVCGMMIEPSDAVGTTDYEGKTYYFCSEDCKVEFDENPEDYAKDEGGRSGGHKH